jgi:hypothetical protein
MALNRGRDIGGEMIVDKRRRLSGDVLTGVSAGIPVIGHVCFARAG